VSPKCPNCGWEPSRGAPKKFDVEKAAKMRVKGLSYRAIAAKLGVTEGAVRAALKRLREA
jgi:transposase